VSRLITLAERIALFDAAEATLLREVGQVSIVKFLGGGDRDSARERWCDALNALLAVLPDGMFLRPEVARGAPEFVFDGGVRVRLDLWELHDRPARTDAWRIVARPGLAPILIDAVADARWGAAWRDVIATEGALLEPIINPSREPSFSPWVAAIQRELAELGRDDALGWIVPADPADAPWPWFTDAVRARRAAIALTVGAETVGVWYRRLEKAQPR
jgi:hypothetical protein